MIVNALLVLLSIIGIIRLAASKDGTFDRLVCAVEALAAIVALAANYFGIEG